MMWYWCPVSLCEQGQFTKNINLTNKFWNEGLKIIKWSFTSKLKCSKQTLQSLSFCQWTSVCVGLEGEGEAVLTYLALSVRVSFGCLGQLWLRSHLFCNVQVEVLFVKCIPISLEQRDLDESIRRDRRWKVGPWFFRYSARWDIIQLLVIQFGHLL